MPNVSYKVYDKKGNESEVHNPSGLPEITLIDHIDEPYIRSQIITTTDFIGPIMTLCLGKRGELLKQEFISGNRVELTFDIPLGEIVIDFYDKLKSISKGYASFDYHLHDFRPSRLVKLDVLLNGESVDALSTLTHADNAVAFGRKMCEKLKELIPRHQFDIAIQAAIGAKIIARETIKAVRKDVTAKCYGGDVSRKRKLLEKQKAGKKRMKQVSDRFRYPRRHSWPCLNSTDGGSRFPTLPFTPLLQLFSSNSVKSSPFNIIIALAAIAIAAILAATKVCAQVNAEQMVRVGQNALYFDDYMVAIQYFNQAITAKPYLAQPYFLRAIAKLNLEDYLGAEADASEALERNPFIVDAYEVRGVARQNRGRLEEAVADYDQALTLFPKSRSAALQQSSGRTKSSGSPIRRP